MLHLDLDCRDINILSKANVLSTIESIFFKIFMNVHFIDFQGFDQVLSFSSPMTVIEIKSYLCDSNTYEARNVDFYFKEKVLQDEELITSELLEECNVIAIINKKNIPAKSFPKVNNAFSSFADTKYEKLFRTLATSHFKVDWNLDAEKIMERVDEWLDDDVRRRQNRRNDNATWIYCVSERKEPVSRQEDPNRHEHDELPVIEGVEFSEAEKIWIRRLAQRLGTDPMTIAQTYLICERSRETTEMCLS